MYDLIKVKQFRLDLIPKHDADITLKPQALQFQLPQTNKSIAAPASKKSTKKELPKESQKTISSTTEPKSNRYTVEISVLLDKNVFIPSFYQKLYKEELGGLEEAKLVEHWLNKGIENELIGAPFFSISYYKQKYEDLSIFENNAQLIEHWVKLGRKENRTGSPIYNTVDYSNYNPNLYLSLIHI